MKKASVSRFFSLLLSFSLLIGPLPISAMVEHYENSYDEALYIYLGKEVSNIADLITEISQLDNDYNSPLHLLKQHIDNGFLIGEADATIEVIDYAQALIKKNYDLLDRDYADNLLENIEIIIQQIIDGILFVNTKIMSHHPSYKPFTFDNAEYDHDITRRGIKSYPNLLIKRNLYVNNFLTVQNNAQFNGPTAFNNTVDFHAPINVDSSVTIQSLSVGDLVVQKISVTDLIVQNLAVLNTFSANDSAIEDLTITSTPVMSPMKGKIGGQTRALSSALTVIGKTFLTDFTTPGVVHNDATGLLSSSLIVNADITPGTIANTALATISSTGTPGSIVELNGLGNFTAHMITITGIPTVPTDVATKAYVDAVTSTGLDVKNPAEVVSVTNVTLSGLQTIDGVALNINDRVLLVGQINPVNNGLWLAQAGVWIRPADFANGATANQAYVLILEGTVYTGSSWVCTTPTAIIGTDALTFTEFTLPNTTTAANIGAGTGQLFANKTGSVLNFRTLIGSGHVNIVTNTNDVTISTDATNANLAGTIVARDGSNNFSAGTITASLTGAASLNVLKTGDTMTGSLNMNGQSAVNFYDSTSTGFVGIQAPTTVPTSYTLALPSTVPTGNQTLRANLTTPTNLEWFTDGGTVTPAMSNTIYVAKYGNDVSGNGSLDAPYASLSKAITTANVLSSTSTPITIQILAGVYIEDNSAGPLTILADGISIIGASPSGVIIMPNTPANNLLLSNNPVQINAITFESSAPLATCATLNVGNLTIFNNVHIFNFALGVQCSGSSTDTFNFNSCLFINDTTAISINNVYVEVTDTTIFGTTSLVGPAANNGITVTGSASNVIVDSALFGVCTNAVTLTGNGLMSITGSNFRLNTFDVIQNGASHLILSSSTFADTTGSSDIKIQINGAGTLTEIIGCEFNGNSALGVSQGTGIVITNNASVNLNASNMHNYTTGLQIGAPSDTSSTILLASAFVIENCTNDIMQQGSSTLLFNASTATSAKIDINDGTNVNLAFFDLDTNSALTIGSTLDQDTTLIQTAITTTINPEIEYKTSLYSTQAIGFNNLLNNPSSWFVLSNANVDFTAITTDNTQPSGVQLFSDTGSPVGSTSALRGWTVNKNGSSAELSFAYQNSDTAGQVAIAPYTVVQFDGVNNQVQLPETGTQIVFGGDTNLYRNGAGVLQTDDNFVVGTLTPGKAVTTDPTTNQLLSSVTTNTELSYLSGTTSSVQTQINGKVAKAGDTMTGTLGMLAQNQIDFYDSTSTGFVGIQAPTTVPTSYTVALPSAVPTGHQALRANLTIPTNLEWFTAGGAILPAVSKVIYVTKYGNDSTGDGSYNNPYLTLSKAIITANSLATTANPICILMNPGIYVENNSAGPLTVTAAGISIVGSSTTATMIMPSTPTNDLLLVNNTIRVADVTFASAAPGATGVSLTAGNLTTFNSVRFVNFATGVLCSGGTAQLYGFNACLFIGNTTGLNVNNCRVESIGTSFFGTSSVVATPVNTGVSVTGSGANAVFDGGVFGECNIGLSLTGNSTTTISATAFKLNIFDVIQSGASHMVLTGSSFELTAGGTDVDIQISGPGTIAEIVGCQFNGDSKLGVPEGQSIVVSNGAYLDISSGSIKNYNVALQIGVPSDTSSTMANISGFNISSCTTDISQQGSSTLRFDAGTATSANISINDGTNVNLAFFDLDTNDSLTIGSTLDEDTTLIQVAITTVTNPEIAYKTSLYSTQAVGLNNLLNNSSSWFVLSNANVDFTAITTDNTQPSGVQLFSDTGSPVGSTSALRGWTINKNGSSAELSFAYQNSDTVGQIAVAPYTVVQFDGLNNLVQLPTAGTQIVFDGDTNLYRSGAGVLQTDDNFVVGTLTPGKVVTTDPVTNQLLSSVTTNTELSYLSGTTSSVQTQINSKVAKAGDIMTGTLQLPAGTAALPSLVFTGSTTTGLSAATANTLSFDSNGAEIMNVSPSGVTISSFTTTGVVHNSAAGLLSSSLIVNTDITDATIANAKLATISSGNTPGNIVVRDISGNFAANIITASLSGNATTATTATNFSGSLTGDVTGTQGATVVSFVGGQTAANVAAATVLANAATNIDTGGAIVKRDSNGNFAASIVSMTDGVHSGNLILSTEPSTSTAGNIIKGTSRFMHDFGTNNTFVGINAGNFTTSGTGKNSGFGNNALTANSTGSLNTAVGNSALAANTIGTNNSALGNNALLVSTIGTDNTAIGNSALTANTTGIQNTALGSGALSAITTGTGNIGLGYNAGNVTTTGIGNIYIGNVGAAESNAIRVGTSQTACFIQGISGVTPGGSSSPVVINASGQLGTGVTSFMFPAGSIAVPSIQFTGSTNTGFSAPTANVLSFDVSGVEIMNISSSGVAIDAFTTAGVVHNNVTTGLLTSSLIVNADITDATIANAKLATISSTGTPGSIVEYDGSGDFSAHMITITGTVTNPTDTATKAYVDAAVSTGIVAKTPAIVVAVTDIGSPPTGLLTIDGVTLVDSNRVLLTGQTNEVQNGLWLAHTGAWTRPTDFASGSLAGQAYVLILSGTIYEGSSWLCNTPTAIIDTNNITFELFTLPNTTTGANIGAGTGLVFANKTGATLNFRSLIAGTHLTYTTNTNDVTLTTDATNANTPSTIVARDSSNNFAAGTITANLTGSASNNVLKAGDTMTGTLTMPAGSATSPSIQFTGSTNTGLSAAMANTLSFDSNGVEIMNISPSGVTIDAFGTAGVVHNSAAGLLTSSLIVDADISPSAAIANSKLAGNPVSSNTINTIVLRDGSGNFAANIITASLSGNATTATTATNFSGSLTGDVTGTQSATVVSSVGGQTAANVAAATVLANAATNIDTGGAIVKRDSNGNFAASIISMTDGVHSGNLVLSTEPSTSTAGNIIKGTNRFMHDFGTNNTFLGLNAGNFTMSGAGQNSGFGNSALTANTTGSLNTAVGNSSLAANSTGASNTAVGNSALAANTIGTNNSALGCNALLVSTIGTDNSAVGSNALTANTTGIQNTALGSGALSAITTGTGNIGLGYNAGNVTTTGIGNIYIGNVGAAESNAIRVGTSQTACFIQGISGVTPGGSSSPVVINASGQLGTGVTSFTFPAGSIAVPSIQFTGSTNTGFSAPTANVLSFDVSGVEIMNISSSGVAIDAFTTAGVVHNNVTTGLLTSSLIVNADISATAAIANTKLAGNPTSSPSAGNTIVLRDASGNFAAGTITANLIGNVTGNVTGSASLNVLKSGDTMTGTLQLPAGTTALPSLVFTGSTTAGLSANSGDLSFSTNGLERFEISSAGILSVDAFTVTGVVHNDASGNLSSSLIVDADVSATAAIEDTKLGTIATTGKVANTATTATPANNPSTIVERDATNNFAAGTITANLIGNVTGNITGSASLNVLKAGDTMTGTLQLPAGTAALPALVFTGSTTTGLSAATANTLSFDSNGVEIMNISPSGVAIDAFTTAGVVHNNVTTGLLTSSLIVNADISATAAIANSKLAGNPTSSPSAGNTIVLRDASGNFAAGTITANLIGNVTGNVTGSASLNVLKAGDTMTGTLQLPAGTTALPSLVFTGSTTTGLSANSNNLSFSTNGTEQFKISSAGIISVDAFTSPGVVHNDASGNLSSSLIINADISATAAIVDSKLATISTTGKVANSATTATAANTTGAIVARDASGNFSTNMITIAGTTTNPTDVATKAYVDSQVGATGTNLATPNTLVKRDGNASFAAAVISMTDGVLSGNLILSTEPSTSTTGNIIKGTSRFIHDFGTNNTFVGLNAGNFTTSGSGGNSGFGNNALTANSTGSLNTAIGNNALAANTIGASNTATGSSALAANTIGTNNTALGSNALAVSTTGTDNTALGNNALAANATGTSFNTAVGSKSLAANTTGTNNAALGYQSLAANTVGTHNTAVGYNALAVSTTATDNTAIGYNALVTNAGGTSFNTAVGSGALTANTTGVSNTAIGYQALTANSTGSNNIAIGYQAGNTATTGSGDIYIGNVGVAAESNAIRIGTNGTQTTCFIQGINGATPGGSVSPVVINTSGQLGTGATSFTFPAGSAAVPSIQFTGSTNTGFSAPTANVISFDTNGLERMNISSSGITIDAFGTAGVVHNSAAGLLTSSLIVDADITVGTIANNKLATVTNLATGGNIVVRDGNSNFAAAIISMTDGVHSGNLILSTEPSTSTAGNIIKGTSRFIHDFGTNNTFVGLNAGNFTTSGSGGNSGFGNSALTANGTGAFNTAIGYSALAANNIGVDNTALGYNALAVNTTGTDNTALGYTALAANATGTSFNTAVGSKSLAANTTGTHNTALGYNALAVSTTGTDNTAIGYNALAANATGTSFSTAVGSGALATNTTGVNNTAVGYNALTLNTIGTNNTAFGKSALAANTTGINNNAVGMNALAVNTVGTNNTATGNSALAANTTGINNTAIGSNALTVNTIGTSNTAIGNSALAANITGINNVALGNSALTTSTIGTSNTAIGTSALTANTTGINNTALGSSALSGVTTGTGNIGIGTSTGTTLTTGSNNIYIGSNDGTAAEALTIRIGSHATNTPTACFIQGIFAESTTGGGVPVVIDTNGNIATITIQTVMVTANGQSITVNAGTTNLLMQATANRNAFTVTFPPSPVNGQYFTIVLASTSNITVINAAGTGAATIVNGFTAFTAGAGATVAASYIYLAATNSWYRVG